MFWASPGSEFLNSDPGIVQYARPHRRSGRSNGKSESPGSPAHYFERSGQVGRSGRLYRNQALSELENNCFQETSASHALTEKPLTKLRNMQHQIFSHIVSSSFVIPNFFIMQTKNLYGINNKSNGLGVVRMYVTTWVTNKLQMNPVHLQQFLPNRHNWTSVNQLFQAQLVSSKRMKIWQILRFTNKLWNEHNFEFGSSAKLFTICSKVNSQYTLPVYE